MPRSRDFSPTPYELGSVAHFDATAERWDARYEQPTVWGNAWRMRAAATVALLGEPSGRVLDVGAGSGRVLEALAERGWEVAGIDGAPRMAALARKRVPAAAARIVVGRAEELPYDDATFDAAVGIGLLEYAAFEAALRELARVLRPGGAAVLGLRDGAAPTFVWQRAVTVPVARVVKRVVGFGRPLPPPRRPPVGRRSARASVRAAGMVVEREERVGCAVLPDPFDHLLPGAAFRAAVAAERSPRLRRLFATQRLLLVRR